MNFYHSNLSVLQKNYFPLEIWIGRVYCIWIFFPKFFPRFTQGQPQCHQHSMNTQTGSISGEAKKYKNFSFIDPITNFSCLHICRGSNKHGGSMLQENSLKLGERSIKWFLSWKFQNFLKLQNDPLHLGREEYIDDTG